MEKEFNVKFYNKSAVFQKNLSDEIPESDITFTQQINGGQGELLIDLAIPFDDIPSYITLFNFVRVYEVDSENTTGRLIYTGWVSQVAPFVTGGRSGVRVICLGLVSLLSLSLYKDGASFDVTKSAVDPKAIVDDIISNFQGVYPPATGFEWIGSDAVTGIRTGGNVDTVGQVVTFVYQKLKWINSLVETLALADPGWYFFIDAGGDVFFKNKSATPEHTFTIGKDIQSLEIPKSIEEIVNDVTVAYDGGTQNATDATSITAHGKREKYIDKSSEITVAGTALQIATKEVADGKDFKIEARATINNQYDIESIKPGDTVRILNYKKGADIFIDNMLVVATTYRNGVTIDLQLSAKKDMATELIKLIDSQTA